jgi:DNA-binding MurR/RpiR family transcriptional regulator
MISDKIKKGQDGLTISQKRALKYILDHYEESIFLSASNLARKIGVSEATIIRLAQAMGFKGFPEFKRELQSSIKEKISTVSRFEHTVSHIKDEEDILIKVFQEDMENLSQTLKNISIDTFMQVVAEIRKAERIFIIGLRSAYSLSIFFGTTLRYIGKDVRVLKPDHGEFWDHAVTWRKSDLVIGISFPRYAKITIDAIKYAREKRIKCIGITDHLLSPLARHCNLVLTARCDIDSYIESFTAPLSLINAIVTAVSVSDSEKMLKSLKKLEIVWGEKDIYVHQ